MYKTRTAAPRWGRTVLIAVGAFLAGVVATVTMAGYVALRRTRNAVEADVDNSADDVEDASEETDG